MMSRVGWRYLIGWSQLELLELLEHLLVPVVASAHWRFRAASAPPGLL